MLEVKKLRQQTVVLIFVALAILAGVGYALLKYNDATLSNMQMAAELVNLQAEKTVSNTRMAAELAKLQTEKAAALDTMKDKMQHMMTDMMTDMRKDMTKDVLKERDEEISRVRRESERQKETIEKLNDGIENQKSVAQKLSELLAKTQKERDVFKTEKDTLLRPDSLPCTEALQAKDTAIAALLGEQQMANKTITALKYQAKKEEKRRDALAAQLNETEAQLTMWKQNAIAEQEALRLNNED